MKSIVFFVATLLTGHVLADDTCPFNVKQGQGYQDSNPLKVIGSSSVSDCCHACSQKKKCVGFTFRAGGLFRSATCTLHKDSDLPISQNSKETCGSGSSPSPTPAPTPAPPSGDSQNWVVIAAGSAGFMNYRHQADACHAYQIAIKNGIPESNIVRFSFSLSLSLFDAHTD